MSMNNIDEQYNISEIIIGNNLKNGRGDKTAIYYKKEEISYKELNEMMNRVGNGLLELGLQIEDRIVILLQDSPEFIATFLGIIKIGAVAIPVNTRLQANEAEYYLNYSRAKALVVNRGLWEEIKYLRKNFIYLKHIIVIENDDDVVNNDECLHYHHWIDNQKIELEAAKTTKDDQALWLFTSGTTGKPKAVMHLHHDIEFCAKHFGTHVLNLTEEDIIFCSSKLFFAYGLGNSLYYPLFFGASIVLLSDRTTAERVYETIEEYRPTVFFGVPTLYNSLLRHANNTQQSYDLSSIRICISSAEPLPVSILNKWQEKYGLRILDAIGCTETLHAFISNTMDEYKDASSGKVVPGYAARIVGTTGEELSNYDIGDLLVKGDSIGIGYFNKHEATKSKFIGEWLVTGDKYYKDDEGFYFYCGRSDEMIKICGMWVSPYEIESWILKSEYVLEAAVVGIANHSDLINTKGFVVLKDDIEPSDQIKSEIMSLVDQNLPSFKRLYDLEFVKELPKTATGKIQRYKLQKTKVPKL